MVATNKNKVVEKVYTHEGGRAQGNINYKNQLLRTVCSCLLGENTFYEDGTSIEQRIKDLVPNVKPDDVKEIAIKCRNDYKLRHVPLLITRIMAGLKSHKHLVGDTLYNVIQRVDEIPEFLAIYWKDKKQPISAQVKKSLAKTFNKFDEYQFAKYNRDKEIKLSDVAKLVHIKPKDKNQELMFKKILGGFCKNCLSTHYDKIKKEKFDSYNGCNKFEELKLKTPDTWEVLISACGSDSEKKKDVWIKLINEKKIGGMAMIRNLRNMKDVGVPFDIIKNGLLKSNYDRVLPFRFITASKYIPELESTLEDIMLKSINKEDKLNGKTAILIDVSGSMDCKISDRSDATRMHIASSMGILLREICEEPYIYTFSNSCQTIPNRHGFALKDLIVNSQPHSGTRGAEATQYVFVKHGNNLDRLIIITDEQWHDHIDLSSIPKNTKVYINNIGSYKNGVFYGNNKNFTRIDGFSETVIRFIQEYEKEEF